MSAAPSATSEASSTTTSVTLSTGDLEDPEVREIEVDGAALTVAWADDVGERSQGLRGVTDLGDLDGMVFDMGGESASTFTMSGVPIPLDIYFFDPEGGSLGMLEMEPCLEESCPSYSLGIPFRFALEVPAGSLQVGASPRLGLP
jgi:uncharacterized membrane protein (UPF0127 family)